MHVRIFTATQVTNLGWLTMNQVRMCPTLHSPPPNLNMWRRGLGAQSLAAHRRVAQHLGVKEPNKKNTSQSCRHM